VPKCAGTAIRWWLYRAFPGGFGSWYPPYVFDERTLEAAGLRNTGLRAFSTHWIRKFPQIICGRRMRYFTLLRDPAQHVISWVRYYYQVHDAVAEANQAAAAVSTGEANRAAATTSTRDLVQRLLDGPADDPFRENMQTNYFALYAWCELELKQRGCHPETYHLWPEDTLSAYRRERLDLAKEILRSFIAVGTVERVIDTLDVLRDRANLLGFNLCDSQELTFENVTSMQVIKDTGWIGEHDPVGRRFLESIADDTSLYAFAREQLERGLRKRQMRGPSILRA